MQFKLGWCNLAVSLTGSQNMHTANKTGLDFLDLTRSNLTGFETKSCLQGTRLIQQVLLEKELITDKAHQVFGIKLHESKLNSAW